jgi:hypothetical protein
MQAIDILNSTLADSNVSVLHLPWSVDGSVPAQVNHKCDMVIAADCTYLGSSIKSLISTTYACLREGGFLILADPGREYNDHILQQALGLDDLDPLHTGPDHPSPTTQWALRFRHSFTDIPLTPGFSASVITVSVFQKTSLHSSNLDTPLLEDILHLLRRLSTLLLVQDVASSAHGYILPV